ncbi:MAG: zinc-dependent alcohol dehydrogenase family protein [Ardenticatenaceae bacterium]|nr:zinc-dependent alcohol dehydrogenase family protein [Ardenticatenaceae bacterium]
MRAMRLRETKPVGAEPLTLTETAVPEPGPGQIRLHIHVCGVCHTDLHTVEGELDLPRLPLTPGHQIVGSVDKLGPGSQRFQVGDRVGVAWLYWACGECEFCVEGQENLCLRARFTGLQADGGYAEYIVVAEDFAFPIPDVFSDEHAAPLLCAGIIGYRALRLSGIQPGQRLGLYGFGGSAHLTIQAARHWDCEVYVFTRSEAHRRHARDLGAVWAGDARDDVPRPLHASITFAPAGWIIPLALGHLRPGGTLAVNAIHTSPIPEMPYERIYHERVLRSVTNFTRKDAEEFLRLAAEIPMHTDIETYPLAEANTALQRLKASAITGTAVLQIAG